MVHIWTSNFLIFFTNARAFSFCMIQNVRLCFSHAVCAILGGIVISLSRIIGYCMYRKVRIFGTQMCFGSYVTLMDFLHRRCVNFNNDVWISYLIYNFERYVKFLRAVVFCNNNNVFNFISLSLHNFLDPANVIGTSIAKSNGFQFFVRL